MVDIKNGLAIIVNSLHVQGKKNDFQDSIVTGQQEWKKYCKFFYTGFKGHAPQLTTEVIKQGYKTIIAAGGDGTVNEVARNMIGTELVLGILPLGSGNGLARHVKIPIDRRKAFEVILQGKQKFIDTAYVNGTPFVSIAGVGFDARVANLYDKSGQHGFLAYTRIVMKEYLEYTPRIFSLILDGKTIKKEAMFVSFANSNQFGYNTMIAPEAMIDDGLLDVVIVRHIPFIEIPNIIRLLLSHDIHRSEFVEIHRAGHIEVDRDRGRMVNIDGEAIKMDRRLDIKAQPASLRLLIP